MSGSLRVVVADDEPDVLDYLRRMLVGFGHQVVAVAENGKELVEQCIACQPDLVISDISMPGQNGIEAIVEIWNAAPVPVVLVTGLDAPDRISFALQETVLAYLTKPFKKSELREAIARAIQRFDEFRALHELCGDRRQAIRNRELLAGAKGMMMLVEQLTERDAFCRMQTLAEEKDVNILQIAREYLDTQRLVGNCASP